MGKIITFSGPRGVGKTAIMNDLHERCSIQPIVAHTTRDPRPTEIDGKDYHFVTDYEFDAIRRTQGMFDVLTLRGKKYGTPFEAFDKVVGHTSNALEYVRTINLAAASALQLRKEIGASAVKSIFILPECWSDIEQQMRNQGISEQQILERRAAEPTDLTMLPEFDRIIVNGYNDREAAFRNAAGFIASITGIQLPAFEI